MIKKGMAVTGLTAALTLGTAFSAWAAAGWVQNNGQWQYQDNYGYIVKNEWQKGADGQWRYLNSSGYIASDTWVDDEYYVDSNGIMVTNGWLQINGSPYSDEGTSWYYFDAKGKTVKDGWKKIGSKWYYFDDGGLMLTGWVDQNQYYTQESGEMLTGWQLLDPPEDADYSSDMEEDYDPFALSEHDGRYWYYFKPNGKKMTPREEGGENGVVRIDKDYYCMNQDGALQYGWKNVTGDSGITGYKYFLSSGKMVTGWYAAEAPRDLSQSNGGVHWYYFNSKGVPKSDVDGVATVKDLITISGKIYLFNEFGNPVYGLRKVYLSENSGSDGEYTSYYFGRNENECWAHKGRQQVEEDSGETNTFYFNESGRGYTGVRDNSLYFVGKIQRAQDDKYEVVNVPGKNYGVLVNSSGKVMKNTTVKMSDGTRYKTNASGQVVKIGEDNVSNITGREPEEPDWTQDGWYY